MRKNDVFIEWDFPGKEVWLHGTFPGSICAGVRWCMFVFQKVGVSPHEFLCCDSLCLFVLVLCTVCS